MLRQSPLIYANRVKAATLFINGEIDQRVPYSEAEQMYVALKKNGVPARVIQYAGQPHGIAGSWNNVHRMLNELHWIDKYLKPTPANQAPATPFRTETKAPIGVPRPFFHRAAPLGTDLPAFRTAGESNRTRNVLIGGVLGGAAGMVVCTVISNLVNDDGGFSTCTASGYTGFALGGFAVGGLIGYLVSH
jgi:hypothetical protein